MDDEELRARLAEVGKRRAEAFEARNAASAELAPLVREAASRGMRPTELARVTGLSRQAVYGVLSTS